MTRASRHVVGKFPFIWILLKIASRKAEDNGGRCLSIRLWIPSKPSQVLLQDLRADYIQGKKKEHYKSLWMIERRLSGFVCLSI